MDKDKQLVALKRGFDELVDLAELVVTGRLQVRIAKEYPLEEIQAACDYVATGHADGKVIIKLTD
ncbi:zinc-binding dehydrogenase [Ligilactobacillus agilis]|uniref:zinc-binding dehydrogenase n=1 Tax=Ligilactobacillus agilis TaxID=1601 RepID=UPI00195B4726|nr:zinc-binding dehydrogenase [Ligilactobacillus agilis]MBM6772212.1 zinc-binding dehydrogenase [Ligilactobacillus agilis]